MQCQRGWDVSGAETYRFSAEAGHYAAAFDREDRDELGRRAPPLGMFLLRIWHLRRGS